MKPVIQTVLDDRLGNCFVACIASIIEFDISDIPPFREIQDGSNKCMFDEADAWLRERLGKRIISICMYEANGSPHTGQCLLNRLWHRNKGEALILSGESPRKAKDGSKKYHCVVGEADCWGYKILHDPHPDGGGLIGQPYGVAWIVAAGAGE